MLLQMSVTVYICSLFAAALCLGTHFMQWESCKWCPGPVLFAFIPNYVRSLMSMNSVFGSPCICIKWREQNPWMFRTCPVSGTCRW